MITPATHPENFDWFYVAYIGSSVNGMHVIPQNKVEGGGENPDGFNLAAAYFFLKEQTGHDIIIIQWSRITLKRKLGLDAFVQSVMGETPAPAPQAKRHLYSVPCPIVPFQNLGEIKNETIRPDPVGSIEGEPTRHD